MWRLRRVGAVWLLMASHRDKADELADQITAAAAKVPADTDITPEQALRILRAFAGMPDDSETGGAA